MATTWKKLQEELTGRWDYYRHPDWRSSWGGPFNGQTKRQELFHAILQKIPPRAIIETGAFRGTTTQHLAQTNFPVFTIEGDRRNYGFAKQQLWRFTNTVLIFSDSREGLKQILDGPLRRDIDKPLFFYLDAHWNDDLPLSDELEIVFSKCRRPIVMVDDFQVPDDPGYSFDDYGPHKALTSDYISTTVAKFGLKELYPVVSSQDETGERRGCIVLCKLGEFKDLLETDYLRTLVD